MKILKTLLFGIVFLYLSANAYLFFMQESLIFAPNSNKLEDCHKPNVKLVQNKKDNLRYLEFYNTQNTKSLIVVHGNAGTACGLQDFVDRFGDYGINIFLLEYPGYAADKRTPSQEDIIENGFKILNDLKDKGKLGNKVMLYGESLGSGVASILASKLGWIDTLILQSPYTSIADIAAGRYPIIPVGMLVKHHFNGAAVANKINADTYIFYAESDDVIPIKYTLKQQKNFKNLKGIYQIKGSVHNTIRSFEDFWIHLGRIVKSL